MARRPAAPGVDRRQQILEAALDVFAEDGFEGATTKEIAARADVTQGLIYFYFPSKEDLFYAAFEHQAHQAFDRLAFPPAEASDEPPEVVIRRAIAQFVEALDAPRTLCLMRIMLRVAAHHDHDGPPDTPVAAKRHIIREQTQAISRSFARYLDAQIARGRLRPVDTALAAHVMMSGLMMAMMRRASGDEALAHVTREALVDTLATIFLHGLLAPPGWGEALPATS